MMVGIGTDLVYIPEIERFIRQFGEVYLRNTFTERERSEISGKANPAQYYAASFACKEAVFKAIGHSTKRKVFDFRCVETLHYSDGAPYIHPTSELREYMDECGISSFQVSISHEKDYALAFVLAERA